MIDDHSRLCVASRAMKVVKGNDVVRVLHKAAEARGYPASFLSDNGLIFSTQRHHQVAGVTEQELFSLGIEAKHARPYHPKTCGKVERFHQTMKKFLAMQDIKSPKQLQRQLDRFVDYYNEVRPHRGIGRKTPAAVYNAAPGRIRTCVTRIRSPLPKSARPPGQAGHAGPSQPDIARFDGVHMDRGALRGTRRPVPDASGSLCHTCAPRWA